jgi:hypothetical protein
MKRTVPVSLMIASVLALGLGGASGVGGSAADPAKAQSSCFYSRNVDSFNAPDDRTVYIRVNMRDYYKLTLFAPCQDVDWNQRIALVSRGSSWICEGNGLDAEVITHSPIGRQHCPVTSIHKLTAEEFAALPKKFRP